MIFKNMFQKSRFNYIWFLVYIMCDSFTLYSPAYDENYETKVLTIYSRMRPLEDHYIKNSTQKKIEKNTANLEWPMGTYGLLSSRDGCPDTKLTNWKTGWLFQNTENDKNENNSSAILHSKINVSELGVTTHFCIKDESHGNKKWPKGTFCIYQYGPLCPQDFHSGYVYWDDENNDNKNTYQGYLPQGTYGMNTEVRFCCRNDGDINKEIELPVENTFCLFPKNIPTCQKVKNMNHILEYVKFDDEDTNNTDTQGGSYPYGIQPSKQDHYLYYCYYFKLTIFNISNDTKKELNKDIAFTEHNISNNENIKFLVIVDLKVNKMKNYESIKWAKIFIAVTLVTVVFGFTAFIGIRQMLSIGYKKVSNRKQNNLKLSNIKTEITKKYKNLKNSEKSTKKFNFLNKSLDCDDVQELAEDNLIPKNSELQHSLALLFIKNQKQ
ncbi:hypothetical protein MXB_5360 [Myxobolus squamalis]|nr:hypothetical protein MXB_5360 [Myxobolus squamalis]